LVVLGHSAIFQANDAELNKVLGAFRMPFFFFMTGVLFSAAPGLWDTVWKRADACLKPYAVVVLVIGASQIIRGKADASEVLFKLFWGTGSILDWPPLWFLPHLFLLSAFLCVLIAYVVPMLGTFQRMALLASMLVCGVALMHISDARGLPLSANVLPWSGAFMLLGYFRAAAVKRFTSTRARAFTSVLLFMLLATNLDIGPLSSGHYGNAFRCTLLALAGIFMMLNVCWVITEIPRLSAPLVHCGQGSLFILLFHIAFLKAEPHLVGFGLPPGYAVMLSVGLGVVGPLVMLWIANRVALLRMLLLPQRRNKRLSAVTVTRALHPAL
jgi:fucose 4-O-acetylase-like acetyltransferase